MKFHEIDIKGYFKLPIEANISSVTHLGSADEGRIFYSSGQDTIYYGTNTTFVRIPGKYDIYENGDVVLMGTYPFPNYWTLINYGSRGIRIVSTGSSAGAVGGTWTITGCDTQGAHTHTTGTATQLDSIGKDDSYADTSPSTHTHTMEYDGLHTHAFDGNWRPAWVKFVAARYDR
jgi:hypothetical protein